MLEIRPSCERCDKPLPNVGSEAMICTFERTFCVDHVETILHNVCPNCGGGFVPRPIRPTEYNDKFPANRKRIYKPVDMAKFQIVLSKNKDMPPHNR